MKFDQFSRKRFLILCGGLAVIASAVGFTLDSAGYISNLMAEFTGFFGGVIITVLLIDLYNQKNKEKQWRKVKQLTYKGLQEHFSEIVISVFDSYGQPQFLKEFIAQRNNLDYSAIELFDKAIEKFNAADEKSCSFDNFVKLYNRIKPEIQEIRKVIIPRVILSSDKQNIIDVLVEFDNYIMELEYMLLIHKYVQEQEVCTAAVSGMLEHVKIVYTEILRTDMS